MGDSEFILEKNQVSKVKQKLRPPRMYKVLIHNDDYTTMDFVVYVLESIFRKTAAEAVEIMLHVHEKGVGTCGVYTHELAETKVDQVNNLALEHEFPLKASMEEV